MKEHKYQILWESPAPLHQAVNVRFQRAWQGAVEPGDEAADGMYWSANKTGKSDPQNFELKTNRVVFIRQVYIDVQCQMQMLLEKYSTIYFSDAQALLVQILLRWQNQITNSE